MKKSSIIEEIRQVLADYLPELKKEYQVESFKLLPDKHNNNFNELGVEVEEEGSTINCYSEGDRELIDEDDAPPFYRENTCKNCTFSWTGVTK